MNRKHATLYLAMALLLAGVSGCRSKLKGTYSGAGRGFFDKLTFTSGNKVEVTFLGGTGEGSYVLDGKKVKITVNNQTQVLTIDDNGCLDGGRMIGSYCKDGDEASTKLSGTYEAGNVGGRISLQFQSGEKVRVTTVSAAGAKEAAEGKYTATRDRVAITVRGDTMMFARRGNGLEGNFDGAIVRFAKK